MSEDEAFGRIEHALRRLAEDRAPPPGWEERVLRAAQPGRARRTWVSALVPLAAAAAVLLLWRAWTTSPGEEALALRIEVVPGARVVRGPGGSVGDTLRVHVTGGSVRALWVYRRDDQLVLACPADARCRAEGDALEAALELASRGDHSVVALSSSAPIPAPNGSLDADVAAAQRAGAAFRIEALPVR